MLPSDTLALGTSRSVIRELFEYGKMRKAVVGEDKVYDFSLGNPSIPAPKEVDEAILELVRDKDSVLLHGYSSAQGDAEVRGRIADHLNKLHGTDFSADNIYMTCGAAASLCISLRAVLLKGEEVVAFAPFFPEYKVFAEGQGGKLVTVPPRDDFQPDLRALESAVGPATRAVIINSPNNPSGVVYSEETIRAIADILSAKSRELGREIYLIADEPYRELVYDKDTVVPYVSKYYSNTLVCYSYSKSLSLPGERIGYIVVPDEVCDSRNVYASVCGAARALGYVCAPTLFQQVVARCVDCVSDISAYKRNRDLIYSGLTQLGYECVKPDGAFYIFVKTLEPDASAFCERAKAHDLLLVSGDGFFCPGYMRIAYCVSEKTIIDSMPAFKALAEEYGVKEHTASNQL